MINNTYQQTISKNTNLSKQFIDSFDILWKNPNMETIWENNNGSIISKAYQISENIYFHLTKKENIFSLQYCEVPNYIVRNAKNKNISIAKLDLLEYHNGNTLPRSISQNTIFEFMKINEDLEKFSMFSSNFYDYECFTHRNLKLKLKIHQSYEGNEFFLKYMTDNFNCIFSEYTDSHNKALVEYTKEIDREVLDIKEKINYIKNTIISNKLFHKNRFEWNDLDNHIWKYKNYIMMDDQNITTFLDIKDFDNIKVYFSPEGNCYNYSNCNKYDDKKILGLEIKDGHVVFAQPIYMYIFDIDLQYGVSALEEEYGRITTSVDLTSVEYIKNYMYTEYNYDRFYLLFYIFCINGTSFDYDCETGLFTTNSIKNIEVDKMSNDDIILSNNYEIGYRILDFKLRNITYLSDDWKEELNWFVNMLIINKNKLTVDEQYNEEEINKFINALEALL